MQTSSKINQQVVSDIDWHEAELFFRSFLVQKLSPIDSTHLEDLVQEAAIHLLRISRREDIRNLPDLLEAVSQKTAADFIRRQIRAALVFEPLDETGLNRPDPRAVDPNIPGDPQKRVTFIILEHFQQNKSSCCELARIVLNQQSWQTVAAETGIAPGTLRAHWSRCVALLRKDVAKDPDLVLLSEWARS